MKKTIVATTLSAALIAVMAVGASAEEANFEEQKIVISYNAAETTPHGQGVTKFKELVEEKTGGKITVDAYFNGTLYNSQTEFEALQKLLRIR